MKMESNKTHVSWVMLERWNQVPNVTQGSDLTWFDWVFHLENLTTPSPPWSSLKRWQDNNVLLAAKVIAKDVALGVRKTSFATMFFISFKDFFIITFGNRMCMCAKMDGCSWKIGQWMNNVTCNICTFAYIRGKPYK